MDMLTIGSIEKILRGEIMDSPVVLRIEEATVLFVNGDDGDDSGTASVRLRLSDSIESFSGFVCKTKTANDFVTGALLCVNTLKMETLGPNKVLCRIDDWNIISNKNKDTVTSTNDLERIYSEVDMNDSDTQNKLVLICLADVDLSTGKKNRIRVRIVWKSSIKTYDDNQHKFFCFDVMDDSGRICIKAFDLQCDRIFSGITVGEMIELSKFYVTVANKKYSQLTNDYEIIVQEYTQLVVVHDIAPISVQPTFQFHLLAEMELLKVDGLYDAIGIIKSIGSLTIVRERITLRPIPIIKLLLFDSSGDIQVNLWNDMASSFVGRKNDILAVKSFRLCVYQKKYILNSVMGSDIFLNVTCNEAIQLRSLIGSSSVEENIIKS